MAFIQEKIGFAKKKIPIKVSNSPRGDNFQIHNLEYNSDSELHVFNYMYVPP